MLNVRNWKISSRLLLPGLIGSLAFAGVLAYLGSSVRDSAYRQKAESIRSMTDSVWGVIEYYGKAEIGGRMTRDQAQAATREAVRNMRYAGGSGYFWINDTAPRMVMHPANPKLDGQDLTSFKDPDGVPLFEEMRKVCRAAGAGVVRYRWPKPGSVEPVAKISYVRLYDPWGWIVGTGVYVDDVEAEVARMARLSFGALLLIICVCGPISLLVVRDVSRPLERIASGLSEASATIAGAAGKLLQESESIASGAVTQSGSVSQTRGSVGDVARSVAICSEEAAAADSLMAELRQTVDNGRDRMKDMTQRLGEFAVASRQVSDIAKTIGEIAFQTNLLALNAAVEAARAGEAGAGFGVVAEEVRNLANRVSTAARESSGRIDEALKTSTEGTRITSQLLENFAELTTRIGSVTERTAEIARNTARQRDHVREIEDSFSRIEETTRANESVCHSTTAMAGELREQADSLENLVGPLRELVHGRNRVRSRS